MSGANMHYKLRELNMESLQEMYALKFYKVHHYFPKSGKLDNNKEALIFQIKFLSKLETQYVAKI